MEVSEDCKNNCLICFEPYGNDVEFTQCFHKFHSECINIWKKKCISNRQEPMCPICRHSLVRIVMSVDKGGNPIYARSEEHQSDTDEYDSDFDYIDDTSFIPDIGSRYRRNVSVSNEHKEDPFQDISIEDLSRLNDSINNLINQTISNNSNEADGPIFGQDYGIFSLESLMLDTNYDVSIQELTSRLEELVIPNNRNCPEDSEPDL